jgi:hypothetical protein
VNIQDPATRRYIYGIVLALIPVAQLFRLIPEDSVPLIINVVTAVLGMGAAGLALPNTPNGKHEA